MSFDCYFLCFDTHVLYFDFYVLCSGFPVSERAFCHIKLVGPRQANLVLIAYASSEGSGEPAHPRSLARTSAARSYRQ